MDIHDSLHRVLAHKGLVCILFYDTFFERCPQARSYFAGVNMQYQALLLTMALRVIEDYHLHGYPAMGAYLKHLGHKHHRREVPTTLYAEFGEALQATLKHFHGKDWDGELAQQWREALDKATATMLQGYGEPVCV
jgi:hemoglobin-like flavoprotein